MLSLTAITTSVKTVHTMLDAWLAQLTHTHGINIATTSISPTLTPIHFNHPNSASSTPRSPIPDTLLTDLERAAGILHRLTAIQKTVVSLQKQASAVDREYIRDLYHGIVALQNLMDLTHTNPAKARRTPLPPLDPRLTEPLTKAGRANRRASHKPYDRQNPKSRRAKLNADERRLGLTLRAATKDLVTAKSATASLAATSQANTPQQSSADIPVCTESTSNLHTTPAESSPTSSAAQTQSQGAPAPSPAGAGAPPPPHAISPSSPSCPSTPDDVSNPLDQTSIGGEGAASPAGEGAGAPSAFPFPRTISALPDHLNPDHQPNLLAGIAADLENLHDDLTRRLRIFFDEMPSSPDHLPPAATLEGIQPLQLPPFLGALAPSPAGVGAPPPPHPSDFEIRYSDFPAEPVAACAPT